MRMLLFVILASVLLGCCSSKKTAKEERTVFYGILDDTVYTYQKFYILDSTKALNYLDMESYGYHIFSVNYQGDSMIEMVFDKEIDILQYKMSKIVKYYNGGPNSVKKMLFRRVESSNTWEILMDGELYKYSVIDSLDVGKSKFVVDTVNHWLDDVE